MIAHRIIEKKRNGTTLEGGEVAHFFRAYLDGDVSEAQVAALLMAVYFQGLEAGELEALVEVMIGSGAVLDLSYLDGPAVDKHSTGGVGDKVSLALAPVAVALGLRVPMMSGRGLGHTGGTLDKLESVPGFRTDLTLAEFQRVLRKVGCAMIGQTEEIAPLDKRLYALRHLTATVPSIPLIAASIMSKKVAEGIDGLVLDVKRGAGAFIPDLDRALTLARTMADLRGARGVRTAALVTAMDRPLGRAVGNALEVREAVACLQGEGPSDLRKVVVELVAEMLIVSGDTDDRDEARARIRRALDDGSALEVLARLVEAQGGDARVADDPDVLPAAPEVEMVRVRASGVVLAVEPVPLGNGVVELGGGRKKAGEAIDPRVGFVLEVGLGDEVVEGDPLAAVHAADPAGLEAGVEAARRAIRIGEPGDGADPLPLVSHRVGPEGTEELGK